MILVANLLPLSLNSSRGKIEIYSYINAEKNVALGEIVGQALNLNNDVTTGVVLLGDEAMILAGNMVFK